MASGSNEALASLSYGHMIGPTLGKNHWWRGNVEGQVEFFTGAQFSPRAEWLVGLTPHLRYNFATGTRWIPFFDGGAGVTATSIGPPDLNGTFEFNLKPGVGIQWFFSEKTALTLQSHYMHWSCAGINHPNQGLNGVATMLSLSYFF